VKDPYTVLGVPREATKEQIKQAYRKLARTLHPDRDPGNAAALDRFKEVTVAYDILSDVAKRIRYDRGEIDGGGSEIRRRPSARRSAEGTAEAGGPRGRHPFERFFRQRGGGPIKGADVTYTVSIDAEAATKGTVERIALTNGKHLDVKIPAGTQDGQVLRLKGQGMAGIAGGETGSAHVEIRVRAAPAAAASAFRQEGFDLHVDVPISLPEAVLGGKIEVETPDGPVTMTVPEGANTGTVLRLKGKGAARPDSTRGDQLVHLTVILPAKPDKELTAFVRRWAERNDYDVRRRKSKV